MQKTKTVGLVLPYLKARGTEKQALRLAEGFVKRGVRVVVFVVQGWGHDWLYGAFREAGALVVDVGPPIGVGTKSVRLARCLTLAYLARKYRCSWLFSRAGRSNQVAGLAAILAGLPSLSVLVMALPDAAPAPAGFKRFVHEFMQAFELGFPSRIVSVSRENAGHFSRSYPLLAHRVTTIPNGTHVIDDRQPPCNEPAEGDYFNFCFCGSLDIKRKGLDVLFKALARLIREHDRSRIRLIIAGSGEDELRAKRLAGDLHIAAHVTFLGERSDVVDVMRHCQAFVLPSRREGMPNVLLEAMALGMCCIATDCNTGPREIMIHGVNGLLVPNGDDEALAAAMSRVMEDTHLRCDMGVRAKHRIRDAFSPEIMVNRYLEVMGVR